MDFLDEAYITSVTFNIDRYHEVTETLYFSEMKTENAVVRAVELYLSEEITRGYFENVKHSLSKNLEFEELTLRGYECRGDLLSACIYLEQITKNDNNNIILFCGS